MILIPESRSYVAKSWVYLGNAGLKAEIEFGGGLAATYFSDNVQAPLYRLPTMSYENALPILLADGAASESDVSALMTFYSEVQTLNRGLE